VVEELSGQRIPEPLNLSTSQPLNLSTMLTAIIVAAGSSQRMGFDKLLALLGDKPVLGHTLDAFERTESVNEIILVARSERLGELQELVTQNEFKKVSAVVAGGTHRQDSVRAGLERLGAEARYVAVHDAARPLVMPEQIERVFALAREHGAAALAEPITDTLKRADENRFVTGGVVREGLYAMQTPQIFSREVLVAAYAAVAAKNLSVADEVSAVEHFGAKVLLVPNEEFNVKITYPRDLLLAQAALTRRASP
jgi:2-C-methyl-D-erythritol 4-phosphate cytidylyltransferase